MSPIIQQRSEKLAREEQDLRREIDRTFERITELVLQAEELKKVLLSIGIERDRLFYTYGETRTVETVGDSSTSRAAAGDHTNKAGRDSVKGRYVG